MLRRLTSARCFGVWRRFTEMTHVGRCIALDEKRWRDTSRLGKEQIGDVGRIIVVSDMTGADLFLD
ncbi:hypothetical protein E2C01_013554 [Portunus trituberculatus]|uniref:Uncharacterized protein n=1 Tax=Portunus trituberculatus TaxID=210409 RepID=A0A5B7DGK3_PORTR|nr:hypothetical protein [Portunus trituberculatus]